MVTSVTQIREKLKAKQEVEGLNDQAFASKLGVSRTLWSLVKSGAREPGMKFVKAVMRTYPELTVEMMDFMRDANPAEAAQ